MIGPSGNVRVYLACGVTDRPLTTKIASEPNFDPPPVLLTIRLLVTDGGGVEASGYNCACSSSLPCAGLVGEEDRPGAAW